MSGGFMSLDLNKLELLAKAATPGPWYEGKHGYILGPATRSSGLMDICNVFNAEERNLPYIVAANPTTILELINEIRRLEAALKP